MTLTAGQLQQVQQPGSGAALLAQMHFTTGTLRYSTWGGPLRALGVDWDYLPAGLVKVSEVRASEGIEYPALDLTLGVPDPAILPLAVGHESTYRGRPLYLYLCVMDHALRVVDEPQLVWAGVMDQVQMSTGDGEEDMGAITLRCEQPGKDSRNAMSRRLSDQQHRKQYPGDTGLSRLSELAGGPQTWLTKRFQEQ